MNCLNPVLRCGFAALLLLGTCSAANYAVVSENTTSIPLPLGGELLLTETVIQDGPLPINRFRMHRLRRQILPNKGVLLLLPGLGNRFESYLTSEDGDVTKSFAAFYAKTGFEVWGLSPRETGISAAACAPGGGLDCTPALQWSLQTVVDDVAYIRSRIKAQLPARQTVIGGLSLGAVSALATVNQHPKDYAGLLAWEGSPVTGDPAIQAHAQGFCTQFSNMLAAGVAVDNQSLPFVKLVAQLAQTAPNDPFVIPVPGFPPGLTNKQALVLILSTPNPIAPSPRPGFISAAGDVAKGTLFYSDMARLTSNIAAFNDVTANRVTRDLYCALAATDTTHTANLLQFKKPVMIIQAGLGFGSIMDELPARLGSTSVTSTHIHNFGHVDHMGSPLHLWVLELPIANWLNGVL
jgi:pimeloyl-ACP methyl ester carboxylesterase